MTQETPRTGGRRARRRRAARVVRRGITLMEVVLSVALLSMLAGTIIGGYGSIRNLSQRQQDRINAAEVAHRLILQYVKEGPDTMPREGQPIEQGTGRYRYRLSEEALIEEEKSREGMSVRKAKPIASVSANKKFENRFLLITVNVYPYDELGGDSGGEPLVSLSRAFDPLDFSGQSDDVLLQQILRILGTEFSTPVPAGQGPGAPAPQQQAPGR